MGNENRDIVQAMSALSRMAPQKCEFLKLYLQTGRKIQSAIDVGIDPDEAPAWSRRTLASKIVEPVLQAQQRSLAQKAVISQEWILDKYLQLYNEENPTEKADVSQKISILKAITSMMGFEAPKRLEVRNPSQEISDSTVDKMILAYQESQKYLKQVDALESKEPQIVEEDISDMEEIDAREA